MPWTDQWKGSYDLGKTITSIVSGESAYINVPDSTGLNANTLMCAGKNGMVFSLDDEVGVDPKTALTVMDAMEVIDSDAAGSYANLAVLGAGAVQSFFWAGRGEIQFKLTTGAGAGKIGMLKVTAI